MFQNPSEVFYSYYPGEGKTPWASRHRHCRGGGGGEEGCEMFPAIVDKNNHELTKIEWQTQKRAFPFTIGTRVNLRWTMRMGGLGS